MNSHKELRPRVQVTREHYRRETAFIQAGQYTVDDLWAPRDADTFGIRVTLHHEGKKYNVERYTNPRNRARDVEDLKIIVGQQVFRKLFGGPFDHVPVQEIVPSDTPERQQVAARFAQPVGKRPGVCGLCSGVSMGADGSLCLRCHRRETED